MTAKNKTLQALEDAIRALRDIAELDETRPSKNAPEKVAERALERITVITGTDVHLPGHTARPDEDMFPMISVAVGSAPRRSKGAPFYSGPIGKQIKREA